MRQQHQEKFAKALRKMRFGDLGPRYLTCHKFSPFSLLPYGFRADDTEAERQEKEEFINLFIGQIMKLDISAEDTDKLTNNEFIIERVAKQVKKYIVHPASTVYCYSICSIL